MKANPFPRRVPTPMDEHNGSVPLGGARSPGPTQGAAGPAPPVFSPEVLVSRAEGARNATTGLIATTVAVLTFVLFFLDPRDQAGTIDRTEFHLTLGAIVIALFALGSASVFYNRLMGDLIRGLPVTRLNLVASNAFLGAGVALLTLFPALVLFTVGIEDVAILATLLWVLLQALVVVSWKSFALIE